MLDVLQLSESAVNDVILFAAAIFFFITLETRVKRRTALRALHHLRSIVHIVDMHQLSKDPEHVMGPPMPTESSPRRTFTRFELARYLGSTQRTVQAHGLEHDPPVVGAGVSEIGPGETHAETFVARPSEQLAPCSAAVNKST